MNFLPSDYKAVPQRASNYMRFQDGPNRFRVLSSAIIGYEYWNTENKPIRQKEKFTTLPEDIKLKDDGMPTEFKHFWAFVVWNYAEKRVQILELTQTTIQRAMKIKIDNRGGDAKSYDFIITRSGKGFNTEYDIDTGEAAPLNPEIKKVYEAMEIDLTALYDGGDPFIPKAKPITAQDKELADKIDFNAKPKS